LFEISRVGIGWINPDFSALIGIVDVEACLQIIAVGQTQPGLLFTDPIGNIVAPAAFGHEGVEDEDLLLGWPATVGETPFQNLQVIRFTQGFGG
jgi:hypothetical protein